MDNQAKKHAKRNPSKRSHNFALFNFYSSQLYIYFADPPFCALVGRRWVRQDKAMASTISSPVSPTGIHQTQRGIIDSSFDYPNGSSSKTSLRGGGEGGIVGQANPTLSNGIYKRPTSSSSSSGHNALPPGAPNGSRINTVTYKVRARSRLYATTLTLNLTSRTINQNATIKALIDPGLRVSDVIRQLCANAHLGVQEPPALFALRDEEDEELIDDNNMARKIEAGRNFKLCSSPTIEAVEMVDKLTSRDEKTLKMATYTLQRLIRDKPFYDEFIQRGGVEELVSIILILNSSNTLAYALTCIQNLIESCNEKWELFDAKFIKKVVSILVHQERINVCRPATAILKKLVTSGPSEAMMDIQGGIGVAGKRVNGRGTPTSNSRFGFEVIYAEIQKEPNFLSTLMQRLGSADTTLCLYSLSLINSLMRHVSDNYFDTFTSELERLGISRAVTRLMDSNRGDELISSILEYQMNVIRVSHHRLNTAVTPTDKRHVSALSYIWLQSRASESVVATEEGTSQKYKWRKLGFENEMVAKDFNRTGWFGLECCEAFVRSDPEQFAKTILEQSNRPASRRCPWGKASLEVVEILSDHYDIQSGYSTCTQFQPCLLALTRLHSLALRFFLRMWAESGAASSDFGRVSALVRSQVKEALRDEASRSWFDVESDFLESDYRVVRDRQMRELEIEDDFTSKSSVRNLRGRLYRESYEFVRQQRIQCLLEGAWFRNPQSNRTSIAQNRISKSSNSGMHSKPWRFYRLSPNRKYLYYCEATERGPIRSGLDDLPEKIDLNLITDISLHSAGHTSVSNEETNLVHQFGGQQAGGSSSNGNSNSMDVTSPNSLTFSLLRSSEQVLADFVALNASQFSEWTDGLSMLRNEGGLVNTKETADYIQILTDIGVKVKLLDLTGEAVSNATHFPSMKRNNCSSLGFPPPSPIFFSRISAGRRTIVS